MSNKWETITEDDNSTTARLRVFGGWLVRIRDWRYQRHTITFVADSYHKWELT